MTVKIIFDNTIPEFTTADFMFVENVGNATLTAPKRQHRRHPARLVIPQRKDYCPPATPSPMFDGINTDVNTEPFPDFAEVLALTPREHAEPLHCVLHCHDSICSRLVRACRRIPPCRCKYESEELEIKWSQPAPRLDESTIETLWELGESADPKQMVQIQQSDIRMVLISLENHAASRTLQNEEFRHDVRQFSSGDVSYLALSVMERFFNGIRLYFDRTLRETGGRVVSVQQMRTELELYVWTMLQDWILAYGDDLIIQEYRSVDMRQHARDPVEGLPGIVLDLWTDYIDDVIGLVVWYDEQIK